jgi:glycosyltransferase involved in cell wall biosynthesis/thioredoxin-like negative regulator of GroEL
MPIHVADAYSETSFAKRQTGLLFNLPVPSPDVEQLPEGISLCMIVKNEERFLAECLESVRGAVDEICIVDTGSTDRTVEIARSYGAKLEFREWRNDFAWARNESLAMATKRWTLVLDGDEELTPESLPLLRSLRTTPAEFCGVYLNIINVVNDSMGTGTMSHRLARVFPTQPNIRYGNVIHEAVGLVGGGVMSCVFSPISIIHKGYTAHMLESRGKDARNKPLLARAYEENADDPFALFNFGNSAITSGDHDLGIELLERMLAIPQEPKMYYPLAYIMLAQAYAEGRHDNDKSLELLETAAKRFPRDAGVVFMRGQMLARVARYDEAIEAYEQTITMRDGMELSAMTDDEIFEWKVYFAMSYAYERKEDREAALAAIEKARANKPQSAQIHLVHAKLSEGLERYFDAEAGFRAAAALDPARTNVELVNYLLRRQRFTEAIAFVEATSLSDEANDQLIVELNVAAARAMMAHQVGDPLPYLEAARRRSPGSGLAIALYEEYLTARNDHAALAKLREEELSQPIVVATDYVRRAFRLLALGRPADAWDVAERGLALAPLNPELHFNGALALARLGRDAEAADHLAAIDERFPAVFPDAMQMRAALLRRIGDVDGAAAAMNAWVASQGNDPNAVVTGARWLAQNGGRAHARALLTKHVESDRRVATELASMLLGDGELEAAGAVAERALR